MVSLLSLGSSKASADSILSSTVLSAIPQEPYRWASVIVASRKAMAIRYSLLPYMYTLFYRAHRSGSTVMRALAWEFPNDPTLASVDRQFMLGPSLLITPVLTPGATSVSGVFPGRENGVIWYDWYTQTAFEPNSTAAGSNITIPAPLGHIPIHIRGGSIIPLQKPGLTTRESRQNPWSVVVALDAQGKAHGELYLDDGESLDPNSTTLATLSAGGNRVHATVIPSKTSHYLYNDRNPLSEVTIMGVSSPPKKVWWSVGYDFAETPWDGWSYDLTAKRLFVRSLVSEGTALGAWWLQGGWTLRWEE